MKLTLITMGAGNVKVLKETIKSFWGIVDEVVYGDMILFDEDRELLETYKADFNIIIKKLPFNYLYKNGFSDTLNLLASCATNDMVIYANTSEVIGEDYGMADIITNNSDCNTFFFTHPQERFRWFRTYNKNDLSWSGLIHESLVGDYRPYHKPIFSMKDLPKDMDNVFKARVFDSCKEVVYWNQLIKIVDNPDLLAETSIGWLDFAKSNYANMKERLSQKGNLPLAFETGDINILKEEIFNGDALLKEKFESTDMIAFQNDRKHLL